MRCHNCKKKTHLEFKCPCENTFCIACRLPEVHKCTATFDLTIKLEKVVAEKVSKI
jgi:hypothetical protein